MCNTRRTRTAYTSTLNNSETVPLSENKICSESRGKQNSNLLLLHPLKPGFHYTSWRPKLTARVDGDRFPLPVNTGRIDGRAFPLAELTGRIDDRSTRLVETGHNEVAPRYCDTPCLSVCLSVYRYLSLIKLLTDLNHILSNLRPLAKDRSIRFRDWSESGVESMDPGWTVPFFQHWEIGHFWTLNRITQKVADECWWNFLEDEEHLGLNRVRVHFYTFPSLSDRAFRH